MSGDDIPALLDEVERLRRGRNIWRARLDHAREDLAALQADRDRLAATLDRVRALVEDAYEAGYLAHAAQQPSLPHRDELAAVILDATVPFRGPGGQTVPYVQPVHYAMADAILALWNGEQA